jgi:hypothetical protein
MSSRQSDESEIGLPEDQKRARESGSFPVVATSLASRDRRGSHDRPAPSTAARSRWSVESNPGHFRVLRDGSRCGRRMECLHAAVLARHDPLAQDGDVDLRKLGIDQPAAVCV